MGEIEIELLVQLKAKKMRRRSRLVGAIAELALVFSCPLDELVKRVGRHGWIDDECKRRLDPPNDGVELIDRPARIGKHARQNFGERLGAEPQEASVGRAVGNVLRSQAAARAGLVFDNDR